MSVSNFEISDDDTGALSIAVRCALSIAVRCTYARAPAETSSTDIAGDFADVSHTDILRNKVSSGRIARLEVGRGSRT